MNTIRAAHERADYTDSGILIGICRDALAVAYGQQYYADDLYELSADLLSRFPRPITVECERYTLVKDKDTEVDFEYGTILTGSLEDSSDSLLPRGRAVGIVTPELISLSESDITDYDARAPYVVVANPEVERMYFVKASEVLGVAATSDY